MYEVIIKQSFNEVVLETNNYSDVEIIVSTIIAISDSKTSVSIKNKEFSEAEELEKECNLLKAKIKAVSELGSKKTAEVD